MMMRVLSDAALIIDYVYFCEKRGQMLDLGEFVHVWRIANEIAEDTEPEDRERLLARMFRDPE
jgi:MoaA/NifB/PqqE/SkfB family radical SAM enzyme